MSLGFASLTKESLIFRKTLGIEARVYQQCLANNMRGIPKLYNCTEVNGNRVMIMQKLGTDLSRIRLVLPNTQSVFRGETQTL